MKTPYEMIKILATQLQTMTDNEYAYDDENGTSVSFDYVNTYLETMDGMNFDVEEGYYTVETEESEDCDHGPCKGYTFENGWIMWTYPDKPDVVSFHPNHVKASLAKQVLHIVPHTESTVFLSYRLRTNTQMHL